MQLNRFVVEVRGGVLLFFNCTTELDDGWWWGFNASPPQHGPFANSDEAVADASCEMGRFKLVRWDDATIRRKNHEELRPTGHIVVIDTDGALFVKTGERPACEGDKTPTEQLIGELEAEGIVVRSGEMRPNGRGELKPVYVLASEYANDIEAAKRAIEGKLRTYSRTSRTRPGPRWLRRHLR